MTALKYWQINTLKIQTLIDHSTRNIFTGNLYNPDNAAGSHVGVDLLSPNGGRCFASPSAPLATLLCYRGNISLLSPTEGTQWLNSSEMLSLSNEMTEHFIFHKALACWERKINRGAAGRVVPRQHFPSALGIMDLISLINTPNSHLFEAGAALISCRAGGTGLGCPSYQRCPCLLEELQDVSPQYINTRVYIHRPLRSSSSR